MSKARNKSTQLAAALDEIASDNTSGASEILRHAGKVFSLLTAQTELAESTVERARRAVLQTSVALVRAQPDMSPLLKLASAAVSASRFGSAAKQVLQSAENAAAKFTQAAAANSRAAALDAAGLIREGSRVLTHSRSATVAEAFVEAWRNGVKFSVIATESRPLFEGRALAQTLSGEGIPVTLIADAAASLAMERIDFALIGADRITPENLVNKIGTRMITLAARERGLPVYAVCDSTKFIRANYRRDGDKNKAAGELWPNAPVGVSISNRYFEPTPLAYFELIIAEDGPVSVEEAARRADAASLDESLLAALERGAR